MKGSRKKIHPREAQRPGAMRPNSAFSLVEVVIALGIFTFVVVTLMGTMTVALNSTRDSEMRLRAAHVGAAIVGALKANPNFQATDRTFPLPALTNVTATANGAAKVDSRGRTGGAEDFALLWKITRDANFTNLYQFNLELAWPPDATTQTTHRVATSILLP